MNHHIVARLIFGWVKGKSGCGLSISVMSLSGAAGRGRPARLVPGREKDRQAGSPPKGHSRDQVLEAGRVGGC